ncbi:unnamed protein product [Clonostachys rosea]|uniref:Inhibitor I9 domain-containing protein n=1 Tax=Bionectria ochroleuca TaxID=29856 RepID=A0ABY6UI50_BIOOC|nr:unnamed protein product [Clonostachys rosea]
MDTITGAVASSNAPIVEKAIAVHPREFLVKLKDDAELDIWRHVKWAEEIHGKSSSDKGIYTGLEEVLKYLGHEGYIGSYSDDVLEQIRKHPDTQSVEPYLYTWNMTMLDENELGEAIAKDVPLFGTGKDDQVKGGLKLKVKEKGGKKSKGRRKKKEKHEKEKQKGKDKEGEENEEGEKHKETEKEQEKQEEEAKGEDKEKEKEQHEEDKEDTKEEDTKEEEKKEEEKREEEKKEEEKKEEEKKEEEKKEEEKKEEEKKEEEKKEEEKKEEKAEKKEEENKEGDKEGNKETGKGTNEEENEEEIEEDKKLTPLEKAKEEEEFETTIMSEHERKIRQRERYNKEEWRQTYEFWSLFPTMILVCAVM